VAKDEKYRFTIAKLNYSITGKMYEMHIKAQMKRATKELLRFPRTEDKVKLLFNKNILICHVEEIQKHGASDINDEVRILQRKGV
jgi:hypothetical protein